MQADDVVKDQIFTKTGLFHLTLPGHNPSPEEVRQGKNARSKGIKKPRTSCLGMGWAFHVSNPSRQSLTDMAKGLSDLVSFSAEAPASQLQVVSK